MTSKLFLLFTLLLLKGIKSNSDTEALLAEFTPNEIQSTSGDLGDHDIASEVDLKDKNDDLSSSHNPEEDLVSNKVLKKV